MRRLLALAALALLLTACAAPAEQPVERQFLAMDTAMTFCVKPQASITGAMVTSKAPPAASEYPAAASSRRQSSPPVSTCCPERSFRRLTALSAAVRESIAIRQDACGFSPCRAKNPLANPYTSRY